MILAASVASLPAFALTLDDAIKRAFDVSFPLKQQREVVKRSEYSYSSSIDPYLPRVDIQTYYVRSLNNQTSAGQSFISVPTAGGVSSNTFAASDLYNFTGILSYRLFDGGERFAKRKQAYTLLGRESEVLKGVRVDVLYNVKTAFYVALGNKAVVEARREAYRTAEGIYTLTKGRYDAGVAKKSEVLQSEVRRATANIDLVEAIKQYERSLEDVKSLLLFGSEDCQSVEGPLEDPGFAGDVNTLVKKALEARPDVMAQAREIERLGMVHKEKVSAWFPKIDAQLQQSRNDTHYFPDGRQDIFLLNFTYPLFDGVGRYYNMKAAQSDVTAARYRLEEIRRTVGLDIVRAMKDYELSSENVRLYRELVREAKSNLDQSFGEYKAGKGDILSLLQSERELARANENYILAVSKANTAFTLLERVAYMNGE